MNKDSLIAAMAEKSGLTRKDCESSLNAFIESISEALAKKEKVTLIGFGTFSVVTRASRTGRNPALLRRTNGNSCERCAQIQPRNES